MPILVTGQQVTDWIPGPVFSNVDASRVGPRYAGPALSEKALQSFLECLLSGQFHLDTSFG